MKASKALFIYGLVFAILMVGVFTVLTQASVTPADVRCTPFFYSEEDPYPQEFRITVTLPDPYKHEDIDPDSILVGGDIPMKIVPDWPKVKKNFFAFKVDGGQLMSFVMQQVWHMSPLPHTRVDIDVTVTGDVGVDTFEGTFTLTVFTLRPEYDNPHPPP